MRDGVEKERGRENGSWEGRGRRNSESPYGQEGVQEDRPPKLP